MMWWLVECVGLCMCVCVGSCQSVLLDSLCWFLCCYWFVCFYFVEQCSILNSCLRVKLIAVSRGTERKGYWSKIKKKKRSVEGKRLISGGCVENGHSLSSQLHQELFPAEYTLHWEFLKITTCTQHFHHIRDERLLWVISPSCLRRKTIPFPIVNFSRNDHFKELLFLPHIACFSYFSVWKSTEIWRIKERKKNLLPVWKKSEFLCTYFTTVCRLGGGGNN